MGKNKSHQTKTNKLIDLIVNKGGMDNDDASTLLDLFVSPKEIINSFITQTAIKENNIKFTPDQYFKKFLEEIERNNNNGLTRLFLHSNSLMEGKIPEHTLLTHLIREINSFKKDIQNNSSELDKERLEHSDKIRAFIQLGAPLNFSIGSSDNQQTFFSFVLEQCDQSVFTTLMNSPKAHIPDPKTIDWKKIAKLEEEQDLVKGSKKSIFDDYIIKNKEISHSGHKDLIDYQTKIIKERGLEPDTQVVKSKHNVDESINILISRCVDILKSSKNDNSLRRLSDDINSHLGPIDSTKKESINEVIHHLGSNLSKIEESKKLQPKTLAEKVSHIVEDFLHTIAELFTGSKQDQLMKITFKEIKGIISAKEVSYPISKSVNTAQDISKTPHAKNISHTINKAKEGIDQDPKASTKPKDHKQSKGFERH